jgi:hypothetical protein
MPRTDVFFFQERPGDVPVLDWMMELRAKDGRAFRKCFGLIELLREFGNELRRPRADYLRDGVYELRTKVGNVNYRILYGFVERDVALLACGLTKEKAVPSREIDRAIGRIERYHVDPTRHRYMGEEPNHA